MTPVKTEPVEAEGAAEAELRPQPLSDAMRASHEIMTRAAYAHSVPPPPLETHTLLPTVWQLSTDELIGATPSLVDRYSEDARGAALYRISTIPFVDNRQKEAVQRLWAPPIVQLPPSAQSSPPQGASSSGARAQPPSAAAPRFSR